MARIKIPNQAFGAFIKAANLWLARTLDAKTGLEVRLANVNGNLHVSSGADSNYIEAQLSVAADDIAALEQPIFLDVPLLSNYDFKADGLQMVVPKAEKDDQRISFSVPGQNFRIPRKKGEIWKRNFFDLKEDMTPGLILSKEAFASLWNHMELPNSFKSERRDFQICFEVVPGSQYTIHGYDGFGALCHTFKDDTIKGLEGRMTFIEDFFMPCKEFIVEGEISFGMNDRQCFGQLAAPSTGILDLRWTQPRLHKTPSNVPIAIEDQRRGKVISFTVSPKVMQDSIDKACMFLTATEMRAVPIELHTVQDQYALVTRKPGGEGEVRVEGALLSAPPANVEINLQASCWKDYLKEFKGGSEVKMEIMKKTAILSQSSDKIELNYWMPLMPRAGGD